MWTRWGLADQETKDSKPLAVKPLAAFGGCKGRRNSQCHSRVHWRGRGILECTQTHTPENQHLKGHSLLVGSEGSNGKWG